MVPLMPAAVLVVLKWVLVAMAAQFVVLILVSACIQSSRNRWNRFRIACLKKWERDMVTFLFEARQLEPFQDLGRAERRLFIPFLLRVLEVLSGKDGVAVRRLYHQLKLSRGLNRRLRARKSRERALAAQEVSAFEVDVSYPRLMEMLRDPMPFVAHVAARGLAGTRRLDYAGPVLDWILTQDSFQQERQIWILEGFGPPLLPWLEQRMESWGPYRTRGSGTCSPSWWPATAPCRTPPSWWKCCSSPIPNCAYWRSRPSPPWPTRRRCRPSCPWWTTRTG